MNTIRRWWRQPDRYEWLSVYLESQQLRWPLQLIMATTVTALGFVPLLLLWSSAVPSGWPTYVIAISATVLCWSMTATWLIRWPTRRVSRIFAVLSAVCVSAASLIILEPQHGLLACAIFSAIGGLVAFTQNSRFLALVLGIGVGTAVICGVRAAMVGDTALALSQLLLILASMLTVPMMGQIIIQLLGADAVNSDVDVLTGLHNRRGFYRTVGHRAGRIVRGRGVLGLVMVDLDCFKQVNDTLGHAAGDEVLRAVAAVLRRSAGGDAVVARIGGEEFCIASTTSERHIQHLADRVCVEISGLPDGITASVGTAFAARLPTSRQSLDELLGVADRAMYAAKRAGGDQVRHASDVVQQQ